MESLCQRMYLADDCALPATTVIHVVLRAAGSAGLIHAELADRVRPRLSIDLLEVDLDVLTVRQLAEMVRRVLLNIVRVVVPVDAEEELILFGVELEMVFEPNSEM